MKIKLMIFDMDGVIFDSEPIHYNSKLRILEDLGLERELDLSRHVGFPSEEFWQRILNENGIKDVTAKELENRQYDYNLESMKNEKINLTNGLLELLDVLDACAIDCAVASSSDKYFVDKVLDYFEIKNRFRAVVSGDEVMQKKPAPDVYLKALNECNVSSADALCIEDSFMGSLAAENAGIRCIGYINPTSGQQDLSNTFAQIESIGDVIEYI